jgi:hypothetical protein
MERGRAGGDPSTRLADEEMRFDIRAHRLVQGPPKKGAECFGGHFTAQIRGRLDGWIVGVNRGHVQHTGTAADMGYLGPVERDPGGLEDRLTLRRPIPKDYRVARREVTGRPFGLSTG